MDSSAASVAQLSIALSSLTLVSSTELVVEGIIFGSSGRTFEVTASANMLTAVFTRLGLKTPLSEVTNDVSLPYTIEEASNISDASSTSLFIDPSGIPAEPGVQADITAIANKLTDMISGGLGIGTSTKAMQLFYTTPGVYLSTTFKCKLTFTTPMYDSLLFGMIDTMAGPNDVNVNLPMSGQGTIAVTDTTSASLVTTIYGSVRLSTKSMRLDIGICVSDNSGFQLKDTTSNTPATAETLMYITVNPQVNTGEITHFRLNQGVYINKNNSIENAAEVDDEDNDITASSNIPQCINAVSFSMGAASLLTFEPKTTDPLNPPTILRNAAIAAGSKYVAIKYNNTDATGPASKLTFRTLRFIAEIAWKNATNSDVIAYAIIDKNANANAKFFK